MKKQVLPETFISDHVKIFTADQCGIIWDNSVLREY